MGAGQSSPYLDVAWSNQVGGDWRSARARELDKLGGGCQLRVLGARQALVAQHGRGGEVRSGLASGVCSDFPGFQDPSPAPGLICDSAAPTSHWVAHAGAERRAVKRGESMKFRLEWLQVGGCARQDLIQGP